MTFHPIDTQRTVVGTSGPEIIALITPLPSSLFPARVALKATIASSKANLRVEG